MDDGMIDLYSNICDIVARSLYNIPDDDTFSHTSDEARKVATKIFSLLTDCGIINSTE